MTVLGVLQGSIIPALVQPVVKTAQLESTVTGRPTFVLFASPKESSITTWIHQRPAIRKTYAVRTVPWAKKITIATRTRRVWSALQVATHPEALVQANVLCAEQEQ